MIDLEYIVFCVPFSDTYTIYALNVISVLPETSKLNVPFDVKSVNSTLILPAVSSVGD